MVFNKQFNVCLFNSTENRENKLLKIKLKYQKYKYKTK